MLATQAKLCKYDLGKERLKSSLPVEKILLHLHRRQYPMELKQQHPQLLQLIKLQVNTSRKVNLSTGTKSTGNPCSTVITMLVSYMASIS